MIPLIDIKPVDREFYETRIRDFLPQRIIDIHAHIWEGQSWQPSNDSSSRVAAWPARVAATNPIDDLLETYRLMLPGKSVMPMVFSNPVIGGDLEVLNAYAAQAAELHKLPALMLTQPQWSGSELEQKVQAGGFLGIKPYLSFAPADIAPADIRIYDFLPPHQLDVLNRHGWIVMLHIPRPGRLRDPVNLAQLLEIEQRYPNVKLIIAHVGRAYCPEDIGEAFQTLSPTRRMCFDISANTNEEVFRCLVDAVGPRRVLFGSDMPIARMRMRRICEGGRYVNLVPRGLYGDVRADPQMREVDAPEAQKLSFFLYEEIGEFRRASVNAGMTPEQVEDVFFNNARRLLDAAKGVADCRLQ